MTKAILIHGNGGCKPTDNWMPYVKEQLEKAGITVLAPQFPDAQLARASYWLPFLKNELKADENTILIGHSSGALAAMRFAEQHKLLGTALIGTSHTDLGLEQERLSGYFDTPWNWEAITRNQDWILLYASTDDPWIPIAEARYIRDKLQPDYFEYTDQGHFGGDYYKPTFPELVEKLKEKLHLP